MSVTLKSSSTLAQVDYAYTATASSGSVVFTAGACPLDEQGNTVAPGDVVAQAKHCMANLHTALADAGASLADVAKVTVYVAEKLQVDLVVAWDAVRDIFIEAVGADGVPPSTLLGVTRLGYDDQLVEIDAVAVISS